MSEDGDAMAETTSAATEHSITRGLYRHFAMQNWAPLVHITADLTYQHEADRAASKTGRIIDMLMIKPARKKGIGPFDLLAVEIKVTRGDFFSDVKDPAKQAAWRTIAHRHAYAAPTGLIRPDEVPAGSGLLEIGPAWRRSTAPNVSWKVRARYTESPELPASLIMTLAYRAAQAEGKVRGLAWDTRSDEDPEQMRAELVRLRAKVEADGRRLDRLGDERDAWKTLFAAAGTGVPCAACGQPVKPSSVSARRYARWRHLDKAYDEPCRQQRIEAAERQARERWDELSDDDRAYYLERHDEGGEPWRRLLWFRDELEPAEDLVPDAPPAA